MYVYSPILACDALSALLWNWEEEIFTTQQYLFSEYFMSKPEHSINSHFIRLGMQGDGRKVDESSN